MKKKLAGGLAGVALAGAALMLLGGGPQLWFDTSSNCASQPSIDRVFGAQRFMMGSHEYYAVNTGNEIRIMEWDGDELDYVSSSMFRVGNVGDSDYGLLNFSFCDNCMYGVANYKRGTVFFEMDSAGQFIDWDVKNEMNLVPGAMVFEIYGVEYIITEGYLCRYDGVGSLTTIQATDQIVDGEMVSDWGLLAADKQGRLSLYTLEVGDLGVHGIQKVAFIGSGYSIKDRAWSFDDPYLSTAGPAGLKIYERVGNPPAFIELGSVPGDFNRSSLRYPFVFAAKKGHKNSERTWDISSGFVPVAEDVWEPSQDYNYPQSQCAEIQAADFTADGRGLIVMRYSVGQVFKTDSWIPGNPTPTPFPNDLIFSDGFESGDTSAWAGGPS